MGTSMVEMPILATSKASLTKMPEELGFLSSDGIQCEVFAFQETQEASLGISRWIEWAALNSLPTSDLAPLLGARFTAASEMLEISREMQEMMRELDSGQNITLTQEAPKVKDEHLPLPHAKSLHATKNDSYLPKPEQKIYPSLFALAGSIAKKNPTERKETCLKPTPKESSLSLPSKSESTQTHFSYDPTKQKERDQEQGEQQQRQEQDHEQQQEQKHKKNPFSLFSNHTKKRGGPTTAIEQTKRPTIFTYHAENKTQNTKQTPTTHSAISSVGSLYFQFMALMSRILGQAEAEGHQLYQRIKERTDQVDVLIKLQAKINNAKGAIDWTDDQEGRELLEQARTIGVEIPKEKLKWKVEELPLLKENISMRKDSMEKLTQLERTDMQRYLQEASQCHQARSNILKLMKEVGDTFVHNMRP